MGAGKILLTLLVAFVMGVLIVGGCVYGGYNRAVGLDEEVNSSWAQVETVKGVAAQEEKIFLGVAEARKAYFQAGSRAEKARAAGFVESALSRLLVLREAYPQLKSNESFLKLQDSLEGTENRLAVERKRYNDAVKRLNTFTRKLLGRFYAGLAGVEKAEYFQVEEAAKAPPKVSFGDQRGG